MTDYQNRILFLRWARVNFPEAYAQAVNQATMPSDASMARTTLGDLWDSITSAFAKVADALPNLAQTFVTAKAQVDWLKLNAERAKQNLPPLDPATGQPINPQGLVAPPANSQAAQIEAQIAGSVQSVPPWVWIVGAGAFAFVLYKMR